MGNNICACKRKTEYKAKMQTYRLIYSFDLDNNFEPVVSSNRKDEIQPQLNSVIVKI